MASDRLRSALYHSVPKPAGRPAPLWQAAAALDPAARQIVPEPARRQPPTSAVPAGWVCVGIGLLTAWFFPLAHVFFSIAVILAVVAMAAHQVRAGLLLLTGALAGAGLCVGLFMAGIAALVVHEARPLPTPTLAVRHQPPPAPTVAPVPRLPPLTVNEVTNLLGAGRRGEEIVALAASRSFSGRVAAAEVTTLRAYGADDWLISYLRTRSTPSAPVNNGTMSYTAPVTSYTFAAGPPAAVMATTPPQPPAVPVTAPSYPAPPPVDYAARDRQIGDLKSRIEALDEQVRCVREHPTDPRYYWHYYSSMSHGVDQARLDAYLKELDRQRNDLRRQKWAVEGR